MYLGHFIVGIVLTLFFIIITIRRRTVLVSEYRNLMFVAIIVISLLFTLTFGTTSGIVSGLGSVLAAAFVYIVRIEESNEGEDHKNG